MRIVRLGEESNSSIRHFLGLWHFPGRLKVIFLRSVRLDILLNIFSGAKCGSRKESLVPSSSWKGFRSLAGWQDSYPCRSTVAVVLPTLRCFSCLMSGIATAIAESAAIAAPTNQLLVFYSASPLPSPLVVFRLWKDPIREDHAAVPSVRRAVPPQRVRHGTRRRRRRPRTTRKVMLHNIELGEAAATPLSLPSVSLAVSHELRA